MALFARFLRKLQLLAGRSRFHRDLEDELAFHREQKMHDLMEDGMAEEQAKHTVARQVGNMALQMDQSHDVIRFSVETVWHDIRFALRQLGRAPVFTVTAVLMLALGMGASIAIFAFVDAALIQPLPYRDPTRLVEVTESNDVVGPANLSYLDYLDWKRMATSYEDFAMWTGSGHLLRQGSASKPYPVVSSSANFFRALGVQPMLGRDFRPEDDAKGAGKTVVLSYGAWQQDFNSDASVVGRPINMDGEMYTVLGVLPRDFQFAPRGNAKAYITFQPGGECDGRRSCHNLIGLARLKEGVSVGTADAEAKRVAALLERQYPDSNRGQSGVVIPLTEEAFGSIRPVLNTLLGGAALLFLIAGINVTNLLLVRADRRRREFALRAALGATRMRLLRQFFVEGSVLGLVGACAGLACGLGGIRLLYTLMPATMLSGLPFFHAVGLHRDVLLFAAAETALVIACFAVAPVLRASSMGLRGGLNEGTAGSGSLSWRSFGSHLMVLEVSVAVILLVSAGLLSRSLYQMLRVPLAFEPDHLVTVSVGTPAKFFTTDAEQLAVQKQVIDRIAALPGVESVGAGSVLPVSFNGNTDWIRFVGRPYDGHHIEVNGRSATPTYFRTLHTRILRGRDFTADDTADHPHVAIINRRLQEKYFPGEDAIGKQIGNTELAQKSIKQIVGVVDDLHEGALDQPVWPAVYYPEAQSPDSYTAVIARVSSDPRTFLPTMVSATQGVHRELSVSDETTFDDKIHDSQSATLHRGAAWLVGGFAVVALLLSAVGMYGVVAYSVSTRTREIGVRIALGAQRESIYMLVLREAGMLSGIGIALGLALAIGTAALLQSLLFGVRVWDPVTLAVSTVLLAVCSMLASFFPARQAATVDPVNALRSE